MMNAAGRGIREGRSAAGGGFAAPARSGRVLGRGGARGTRANRRNGLGVEPIRGKDAGKNGIGPRKILFFEFVQRNEELFLRVIFQRTDEAKMKPL